MGQRLGCGQANIPTVDNSEIECSEFVPSTCVYIKGSGMRGRDRKYPNLDEYILRQEAIINDLKQSNSKLSSELQIIKREFNRIQGEFKVLQHSVQNINVQRNVYRMS